ncbi:MAG TPA: cysteine--tRNA ligase [Acidobacteriaceae bacterium]
MALELFNTLSGKIEPLFASDGSALRMYCCGPTVYDYGHIGNFRTFLHVDVLRRAIRMNGLGIRHVMNVTDVDDKIIRNASAAGQPIGEYTARYEKAFFEDLAALGAEFPEAIARATENIDDMVTLIEKLASEDIAYKAEDGSWYFRIARFPEYGKLSGKDLEGIQDGARIDSDEYEKDSARDFALWKAAKPGETSWDTRLGPGRPGWHIECSAMAMKYLGNSFDLHAGGEDLMFPHHENEIAQSESASHVPFARHWFHVRFLLVEGKKMSKSEGNFYTLRDLLLKGHRASAIRFLLLSVPYRHQLNFTFDGLTESTNAVERLRTFHQRILTGVWPAATPGSKSPGDPSSATASAAIPGDPSSATATAAIPGDPSSAMASSSPKVGSDDSLLDVIRTGDQKFTAALFNDLNTAEARAAIFDVLRAVNTAADRAALTRTEADATLALLARFDSIFAVLEDRDAELTRAALAWAETEGKLGEADASLVATLSLSDADIDALVAERTLAKKQRNFARADAIRNDLLEKGILLEDSKDGVRWKRK